MELLPLDWSVDKSWGEFFSSEHGGGDDACGCFAFIYACTPLYSARRGQEGVSDPLKLDSHVFGLPSELTWKVESRFSGRATGVLNQ